MDYPEDLFLAAKEAFENAYAPYSKFSVGAALRTDDGSIIQGANVENASYGLSRCAEQSAIQALATKGLRSFQEILVYTQAEEPASPCGACRQVLLEFGPEAKVYCVNHKGESLVKRVQDLLPGAFDRHWLD